MIEKKAGWNQQTPRDQVIQILSGVAGNLHSLKEGHTPADKFQERLEQSFEWLDEAMQLLRAIHRETRDDTYWR